MRSEVYGLAGGGWRTRPRRTQRAGKGSTADWGQGTGRSADPEHEAHIRDAGGVEAQWLVEHRRDLSSNLPMVERKACGPEAGGGAKPRAGEGSTAVLGQATAVEPSPARHVQGTLLPVAS